MAQTPSPRSAPRGIGFFGLLTILFIGLKLTGHIDWSWWLVLLPIYALPAVALLILGVAALADWIADRCPPAR